MPRDLGTSYLLCALSLIGLAGLHRFYLGKWITGLLWLCTGGLFFRLPTQVDEANRRALPPRR